MSVNIGFVGYSKSDFDIDKANSIIDVIFNSIEEKYCTDKNKRINIRIMSGGTNLGIPKLVYEKAKRENEKYGKWFFLVGIIPREGKDYELYPCDYIKVVGNNFGDESKYFTDNIDVLYKIGGGNQSQKEYEMAQFRRIPCFEYKL